MDKQMDVFDSGARARSSDPTTSKEAAQSVQNMRASHRRVLAMFKLYGDMTDEQLAESLHDAEKEAGLTKVMSPSGVRSRRSELSKPNMDRLNEMVLEYLHTRGVGKTATIETAQATPAEWADAEQSARARLLIEGVRSPLWDTGKRAKLTTGRQAIVWGIAK